MATYNLNEDVSNLTDISINRLDKLNFIQQLSIIDAIVEDEIDSNNITEIEFNKIGTLLINHIKADNNVQLQYKFIPTKQFHNNIVESITKNESNLKLDLETNIVSKLLETYKDIL